MKNLSWVELVKGGACEGRPRYVKGGAWLVLKLLGKCCCSESVMLVKGGAR